MNNKNDILAFDNEKTVPFKSVLKEVPSGDISISWGGEGIYIRFDCDCKDALPYCHAACCGLPGTDLTHDEVEEDKIAMEYDESEDRFVVKRESDGFCTYLDRRTCLCTIHHRKPKTCEAFHCTRGADKRGWKLDSSVWRLPGY